VGGQGVHALDFFLAPGVRKTFTKEYWHYFKIVADFTLKVDPLEEVRLGREISHKEWVEWRVQDVQASYGDIVGCPQMDDMHYPQPDGTVLEWLDMRPESWHRSDYARCHQYAQKMALEQTRKATFQALEALIANLNTMNSRSGCIPGSEKILVKENGYVKLITMHELYNRFRPKTFEALSCDNDGTLSWQSITRCICSGRNRKTVRLINKRGKSSYTTDNHRIFGVDKNGLYDCFPSESTQTVSVLGDIGSEETYFMDRIVTTSLAEIMGMYAGDGSVSTDTQLYFSVFDEWTVKRLIGLFRAEYPKHEGVVRNKHNNEYGEIYFNLGQEICSAFLTVLGRGAENKTIPHCILAGTTEIKLAFLRGLMCADGSIGGRNKSQLRLKTTSKDLRDLTGFLIQSLGGIPTFAYTKYRVRPDGDECCHAYIVSVNGEVAHLIDGDVQIPKYESPKENYNFANELIPERNKINARHGNVHRSDILNSKNKDIHYLANFAPCDVMKVFEGNTYVENTYDITVSKNNNFFNSEGVLLHNSQTPFSSVNYGTDISHEGRLIIEMMIKNTIVGLGDGETPLWPVQVFKLKKGVNYDPGDPNYDLRLLAHKSTAKRIYPNYSNLDASFNRSFMKGTEISNFQMDENGNYAYDTEVAYMGSLKGDTIIDIGTESSHRKDTQSTLAELWDLIESSNVHDTLCGVIQKEGASEWMSCLYADDPTTYNVIKGRSMDPTISYWPMLKKIMRTPSTAYGKLFNIITEYDGNIYATEDHPFPVIRRDVYWDKYRHGDIHKQNVVERVRSDDIEPGDFLIKHNLQLAKVSHIVPVTAEEMGEYVYDVETGNDYFNANGFISHNCRTRVIGNVYDPSQQVTGGRGNLSFTTINLPRLAIEARMVGEEEVNGWPDPDMISKGYEECAKELVIESFFNKLEKKMELVCDQLMSRYEILAQKKAKSFQFLMGQGIWLDSEKLDPDDEIREVLKHGTFSYGFIGLAETLTHLIGSHHGETEEAQELGLRIVGFMREFVDRKSQEHKLNHTYLATPAEGLSNRFTKLDTKKFGIISGVTDKGYYTNSFHVPVGFDITAFDKIKIEAPYHKLTNAGHISTAQLDGDLSNNIEAIESIINFMCEQDMGYMGIDTPVDRDPCCGYNGPIKDACPGCGRKVEGPQEEITFDLEEINDEGSSG
jgi:anaerobic ribonucleoside-triphosphate reductase